MSDPITVSKRDHTGKIRIEYHGQIIERGATGVCLRALFGFARVELGFVALVRGDVFTEWFYTDRWYSAFRINSGADGHLKGWYCDISRPAVISDHQVTVEDLELDVYVMPDGAIRLLDEDAFAALDLSPEERAAALEAVETIRRAVANRETPFEEIPR